MTWRLTTPASSDVVGKQRNGKRSRKRPKTDPRIPKSLGKKKPRTAIQPEGMENPVWKFRHRDRVFCPWTNVLWEKLTERLQHLETMTWQKIHSLSIMSGTDHCIAPARLSRDAQRRLEGLKMDDVPTLLSIRVQGKVRAWGIPIGQVCRLLWWDPDHIVYPTTKKNT